MANEIDLLNESENAVERVPEYATWGQCILNVWECVWPKGSMPIPFDASIHRQADRRVRIEMLIIPIDEMSAKFNTEAKFTSESRDWAGVTLKSVKDLGVTVASLKDAYVKVVRKPNGKKYAKKDPTTKLPTGEMGDLTDFLFLKVFQSQDTCVADYLAEQAGEPATAASADAFPVDPAPTPTSVPVQSGPPLEMLVNFARNFVKAAVKAHPGDLAAIMSEVKQQMEVKNSAFFAGKLSADSAEVQAMIMMEMGA